MFLIVVNTVIWCLPLYLLALLRFISPSLPLKKRFTRWIIVVAEGWIHCNNLILDSFQKLNLNLNGLEDLSLDGWYLVVSNHQTWTDILILQRILIGRVPFLKFFIKKDLLYVPFIGIAWWALDFPVMQRYSKDLLKKKPHLKGRDLETTKNSCEKFKLTPVCILNFLEGTRFTPAKRDNQNSPFNNLLIPKSGGAALVVNTLQEQLGCVLDITLFYQNGAPSFWEFLCGKAGQITLEVNKRSIPAHLREGDYENDRHYRIAFQAWVQQLWEEKDLRLNELASNQQPVRA